VSEYQYYEFLAIDRPLTDDERAEVRSLSTRARITATSFVNEYHWGDFRGHPGRLMERYYDAHLYVANWGTRQVMFRIPVDLLALDVVEDFCVNHLVSASLTSTSVVLALTSEDEGRDFDLDDAAETMLSSMVGVRNELAAGDLRPLYLAWLAACRAWERNRDEFDEDIADELEPPVPAGLGSLTAAQLALADFLRLDDMLLEAAAEASPSLEPIADGPEARLAAMARLPVAEKDRLLVRVVDGEGLRVRTELLRHLQGGSGQSVLSSPRRTVAALLDNAERRRSELRQVAAARRREEEARREAARAAAREQRMDELAREGDAAWSRVESMIETRKPAGYDAAVASLVDLQSVAERDSHVDTFTLRTMEIRRVHARKPSLIERLDRARL
jgi:hypothetical protein